MLWLTSIMSENDKFSKLKEFLLSESTLKGFFLTTVGGVSALVSFSYALSSTRKQNASALDKVSSQLYYSGSQLAFRALKWGTFYAVTGCGLFCFGVWKLANVSDMKEFRQKAGSVLPAIPKNDPPQSRTEFKSLTEFMQYLDDEFSTKKPSETSTQATSDG